MSRHESHGYASTDPAKRRRVYTIWAMMIQRCTNPKQRQFHLWGGRGIRVCQRWRASFTNFLADMGEPPTSKHSIDRYPDKNGNYEPGNCRWATTAEQTRNSSRNHLITFNGKTQCLADWANEIGIPFYRLAQRLNKLGWPVEQALSVRVSHRHRNRCER
jgi:hypothetical protein